jgi:hypothetical protein
LKEHPSKHERTVVHTTRCTFGWCERHLAPEGTSAPTSSARDAQENAVNCTQPVPPSNCTRPDALVLEKSLAPTIEKEGGPEVEVPEHLD